ncbi:DNA-directed RNA polymerase [Thoreauomyces humboldtii]|nr:DNA-directed RNA polymerase [Thoreauomyces humboldtii]
MATPSFSIPSSRPTTSQFSLPAGAQATATIDLDDLLFSTKKTQHEPPRPIAQDPPEHSLTADRAVARHTLEERLVLIYACLESRDLLSAEQIFHRLLRSNLTDMREIVDARILNAFIEARLDPSPPRHGRPGVSEPNFSLQRAMDWFQSFDGQLTVKRTGDTFAILVHHHLKAGQIDRVRELVERMELEGVTIQQLLDNYRFDEISDRTSLEAVLRDMGKDVEGIPTADRLLLTAMEESDRKQAARTTTASATADPSAAFYDLEPESSSTPAVKPPKTAPQSTTSRGIQILQKALRDLVATGRSDKYAQQQWLEERSAAAAVENEEEERANMPERIRRLSAMPTDLIAAWDSHLVKKLEEDIAEMASSGRDAEETPLLEWLRQAKPARLSKITITEFIRPPTRQEIEEGNLAGQIPFAKLAMTIGRRVEQELRARKIKEHTSKQKYRMQNALHELHNDGKLFQMRMRNMISKISKFKGDDKWLPRFPDGTRARLGAFLVERLMSVARVRVMEPNPLIPGEMEGVEKPAFEHEIERLSTKQRRGMIRFNPALYEVMMRQDVTVEPWLLPMLVRPRPWMTWKEGGYLLHTQKMVRIQKDKESRRYLNSADQANQMTHVQVALDILGAVPWKINDEVYDVAAAMWNKGEHAPSLPSAITIPELDPIPEDAPKEDIWKYQTQQKERRDKLAQNFSIRADSNYKLEIAKAFCGETIYFPHNLDFRGRAYPMPQHLNHIGNDLCRGLLLFAEGKAVGTQGLRWLKIQIAALAGFDKASFMEREKYTDRHLESVFDSADRPLDGSRWWLQTENPWQLLAACKELTRALRSPNPEEYISYLPIHQDGTCNGLQHYAALGGDELGAKQVNLLPGDKPADVYTGVADKVQEIVDADIIAGVPEAILMKNRVNRKLVKQTVMTNTYGVTFIGARDQIRNRLREARDIQRHAVKRAEQAAARGQTIETETFEPELSNEDIEKCSLYATRKVFESMGALFEGARAIQLWLNVAASVISRSTFAEHVPKEQLEVAAQLNAMGVLPSPFTVARTQVREAEDSMRAEAASDLDESVGGLLGAIASDMAEAAESSLPDGAESTASTGAAATPEDDEFDDGGLLADEDKKAVAKRIANERISKMTSVVWTTPLGLPIVQPYRNYMQRNIPTLLQTVTIYDRQSNAPVNPTKQSTAFPPNFIHSLDASHMMISAIACEEAKIAFAAVHDSYWTHACDVATMNDILRDGFVRIHSRDLMQDLRTEFTDRYAGHKIPVVVELDTPELQQQWKEWCKSKGFKDGIQKTKKGFKTKKISTWVDIEFAQLPARGEFKIEQVKDSTYFFN